LADKTSRVLLVLAATVALNLAGGEAQASDTRMAGDCARGSALVQPLAKIINTRDASFNCVGVSLDDRANILAIRFEKHGGDRAHGAAGDAAADVHVREFTPAELASDRGAVLDGVPGHDAVLLKGTVKPAQSDVPLVLSFLYNGLTGEYRGCDTTLTRGPDDRWHLLDAQRRPVSLVIVKTWGVPVIGTVGIETLQGICSAQR
jgi:hypothetical protein